MSQSKTFCLSGRIWHMHAVVRLKVNCLNISNAIKRLLIHAAVQHRAIGHGSMFMIIAPECSKHSFWLLVGKVVITHHMYECLIRY